jgi:hypothetical protein
MYENRMKLKIVFKREIRKRNRGGKYDQRRLYAFIEISQ